MHIHQKNQEDSAHLWQEFSADLSAIDAHRPLTGAAKQALAEIDAIQASDFDSGDQNQAATSEADAVGETSEVARIASKALFPNSPQMPVHQGFTGDQALDCVVKGNSPFSTSPLSTPVPSPIAHKPKPISIPFGIRFPSYRKGIRQRAIASWDRLSEGQRLGAAIDVTHRSHGYAFTLNMKPEQAARAKAHPNPARLLSGRINRAFKASGLARVPYAFALEIESKTGKLHLHGVILADSNALPVVRSAVRKAGGKLKGRGAARQLDTRDISYSYGWTGYVGKARGFTALELGVEKLSYISNSLRQRARVVWEAARKDHRHH